MVPLLPLRDGVRALPISFFRQSMPSFYMNAPDCICSPGRLPLGAFCAGRDGLCPNLRKAKLRISIHAPRVGRDGRHFQTETLVLISIHAPRAGCDFAEPAGNQRRSDISTHAPRAGCDKVHAPRPRRSRDRLRRPERSENVPGADALCSGDVLRRGRHFLKKKLERP